MFNQTAGNHRVSAHSRIYALVLVLLLLTAIPDSTVRAAANTNNDPNQVTNDPNSKERISVLKPPRPAHKHPAFSQRQAERNKMVRLQIKHRGVKDPNVLAAMRVVPRHAFVHYKNLRNAYADHPLPIGLGQTISQPYIVAFMTEALRLDPNDKVLEIGTGSGYQAAVCAEIVREVYTIEIVEPLAEAAGKRLKELGYENVFVMAGDGYLGWPEKAPFDAIIITAAVKEIPKPLMEQLKLGGRIILPQGDPYGAQTLVLAIKQMHGKITQTLLPVTFVPMTGKATKSKK